MGWRLWFVVSGTLMLWAYTQRWQLALAAAVFALAIAPKDE